MHDITRRAGPQGISLTGALSLARRMEAEGLDHRGPHKVPVDWPEVDAG